MECVSELEKPEDRMERVGEREDEVEMVEVRLADRADADEYAESRFDEALVETDSAQDALGEREEGL